MPPALSGLAGFANRNILQPLEHTASDVVQPIMHLPQAAMNEAKMVPAALTGNNVAMQNALNAARQQNAMGTGFVTSPGTLAGAGRVNPMQTLGQSLGHGAGDVMNLASLLPVGRAGVSGVNATNAALHDPMLMHNILNESGYIRNLSTGMFDKTAIHPEDAQIMAAFIDHARGLSNLAPADALALERDAANIAEGYNIGGAQSGTGNPMLRLANAFDKVLSGSPEALRQGAGGYARKNSMLNLGGY